MIEDEDAVDEGAVGADLMVEDALHRHLLKGFASLVDPKIISRTRVRICIRRHRCLKCGCASCEVGEAPRTTVGAVNVKKCLLSPSLVDQEEFECTLD